MISFFVNLMMLARTLWHGFRRDPEFRTLAVLLLALLAAGTLFYWHAENWSIVDSLYFCVMTIATIGYGDFTPSSSLSKLFTIAFVVLGIGLFASFVAKLVALRLDLHAQAKKKRHDNKHE